MHYITVNHWSEQSLSDVAVEQVAPPSLFDHRHRGAEPFFVSFHELFSGSSCLNLAGSEHVDVQPIAIFTYATILAFCWLWVCGLRSAVCGLRSAGVAISQIARASKRAPKIENVIMR